MPSLKGPWLAAAAMLAVAGCAQQAKNGTSGATQVVEAECRAQAGRLQSGATLASLAGNYRLTLVASSGARSGRTARGDLHIDAPRGSASTTSGTSTIALDSIGAFAAGTAKGPQYGVTALAWSSTSGGVVSPEIMVRFGSLAAPAGTQAIEGSYTALSVRNISADAFTGTWESGEGGTPGPSGAGYFCALRSR